LNETVNRRTRRSLARRLAQIAVAIAWVGCKRGSSAGASTTQDDPGLGLLLPSATLPVIVLQSHGAADAAQATAVTGAFSGTGQRATWEAISKTDKDALVDALRDRSAPDATVAAVRDAESAARLSFRWPSGDAAGLAAAYAAAAKVAAWPSTVTLAGDVDVIEDGPAWAKLAADAATKNIDPRRHFVLRLLPAENGNLEIESAGTARFGLRDLDVDQLSRATARSFAQVVNLFVLRWAQGQRPAADGTLDLVLPAEDADGPTNDGGAAKLSAAGHGHLRVKATFVGEGPDAVAHLEFPDAKGETQDERRQSALDELFGWRDSSQRVEHSAELLEVSKRARERLIRELKPRVLKGLPPGEVLLVKAPFPCGSGNEWMWVDVKSWKGSTVSGTLQSQPDCATQLHPGQPVDVNESDLFDYMDKLLDGTFVGNDTGKLMQPSAFEELDGGRRRVRQ
jgi:uncharacterized protein YegJ (DUF2314 family)